MLRSNAGYVHNPSFFHHETLGTRAFDILHVSATAALGAKEFYTFDARQKALAVKVGMKVKP